MSVLGDSTIDLMKLITWNIQGLGGSKCMLERTNLRQEFKSPSFKGIPDILLLQENHLSANRILSIGILLWGIGIRFGPQRKVSMVEKGVFVHLSRIIHILLCWARAP